MTPVQVAKLLSSPELPRECIGWYGRGKTIKEMAKACLRNRSAISDCFLWDNLIAHFRRQGFEIHRSQFERAYSDGDSEEYSFFQAVFKFILSPTSLKPLEEWM